MYAHVQYKYSMFKKRTNLGVWLVVIMQDIDNTLFTIFTYTLLTFNLLTLYIVKS